MSKFKAACQIDKHEGKGNGIETYNVFIRKAEDEADAHSKAKIYMLETFPQWSLYDINLKEI